MSSRRLVVDLAVLIMGSWAILLPLSPLAAERQGVIPGGEHNVDVNDDTDLRLTPFYAQTAWPTIHRDSHNSDFTPFVAPGWTRRKWTALDGAAVLAAVTIGPEGNLYITTGQGMGHSNLHAYDREGTYLWSSPPYNSAGDLDSAAVLSSPLVDLNGDLYIADADQLWASHPAGDVKWVIPIPAPLHSAAFTVDGFFCGVTNSGQVLILLRTDGSLAAPMLELPGRSAPPGQATPPGLWTNLMDPAIIDSTFAIFFGFEAEVANTPAVNPSNNRIYITAAGPTPTQGVLYGIDFTPGTPGDVHIAFTAPMGAGSATSPTISLNGSRVYAADGAGVLYAFDANSGEEVWTAPLGRSAGSATVGPDGTLYVASAGDAVALSSDGRLLWRENYDDVASRFLPPLPTPTGPLVPTALVDSVLSVSANYLYLALILGYEIVVPSPQSTFLVPKMTVLLVIDPPDGEVIAPMVFLRDTSNGIFTIRVHLDL
jgi:outer membrane protein assembly factor BamB